MIEVLTRAGEFQNDDKLLTSDIILYSDGYERRQ
jgi:hypothetical protein